MMERGNQKQPSWEILLLQEMLERGKQKQPRWEMLWSILPNDIKDNILSRLPVKSLVRFRCVCKHWCNLVTNPHFIKMHLSRSAQINGGPKFVRAYNGKVYSIDVEACRNHKKARGQNKTILETEVVLPFTGPSSDGWFDVAGSCNGLLCLVAADSLYLLNPATKEYKMLPYPPKKVDFMDPLFGYSPRTDEYKVVMILHGEAGHSLRCDDVYVYTLGMNSSWRSIGATEYRIRLVDQNSFALVNGALHWMARSVSLVLISFDIGDEKFRELSLPNSFSQEDTSVHMGLRELGGCLSLYQNKDFGHNHEIWVMKDYGDEQSWTKLFSVTLFIGRKWLRPLYILEKDVVLCETAYGFFILDVVTEQCHSLPLTRLPHNIAAEMYFESLVSVRADGRMDRGDGQERREKEGGRLAVEATCE